MKTILAAALLSVFAVNSASACLIAVDKWDLESGYYKNARGLWGLNFTSDTSKADVGIELVVGYKPNPDPVFGKTVKSIATIRADFYQRGEKVDNTKVYDLYGQGGRESLMSQEMLKILSDLGCSNL